MQEKTSSNSKNHWSFPGFLSVVLVLWLMMLLAAVLEKMNQQKECWGFTRSKWTKAHGSNFGDFPLKHSPDSAR
jgi:hypothetical protein